MSLLRDRSPIYLPVLADFAAFPRLARAPLDGWHHGLARLLHSVAGDGADDGEVFLPLYPNPRQKPISKIIRRFGFFSCIAIDGPIKEHYCCIQATSEPQL